MTLGFRLALFLMALGTVPDDGSALDLTRDQRATNRKLGLESHGHFVAGRLDQAVEATRRRIGFLEETLGVRHWRTADARRLLSTIEKAATLPESVRVQLIEENEKVSRANALRSKHKHSKADELYLEALEFFSSCLGDRHYQTGTIHFNRGENHYLAGALGEAEHSFSVALDIRLEALGEQHPSTATTHGYLGGVAMKRGRYAAAEPHFRRSLSIRSALLGPDHRDTLKSRANLAASLYYQGKHADAEPLLRQILAYRIRKHEKPHRNTASSYSSLASNLYYQGRYSEAGPLWRKALEIRQGALGVNHPATVNDLAGIAGYLEVTGDHAAAEDLLRRALDIQRSGGDDASRTVRRFNSLIANLLRQGKTSEATALAHESLHFATENLGSEHPERAASMTLLAQCLRREGVLDRAKELSKLALEIRQQVLGERHPVTARSYLEHGRALWQDPVAAEPWLRKAVDVFGGVYGDAHPQVAAAYTELAWNLCRQERLPAAEEAARRAADTYEIARLRVSYHGLERVDFSSSKSPLLLLGALSARNGKPAAAWRALESNLARGLLDAVSDRLLRPRDATEQREETELLDRLQRVEERISVLSGSHGTQPELQRLREDYRAHQNDLSRFHRQLTERYGPAAGDVYTLKQIQITLAEDMALVAWLDAGGEAAQDAAHYGFVVRHQGEPLCFELPGSGANGAWSADDDRLVSRVRAQLSRPPVKGSGIERAKQSLYQQRIAPLEAALSGVRHLIVLPAGRMAGIPVEALTDRFVVSYAPSGTLFGWLASRPTLRTPKRALLALGDPTFDTRADGTSEFPRLPETRREVEKIGKVFEGNGKFTGSRVLLGLQSSEERLNILARSGELAEYAYLHLATHAILDDRKAIQSSLILARQSSADELDQILSGTTPTDGRLTPQQIMRTWSLSAECVVLSACETGLGKFQGGEGFIGFSQALLLSGARSVVLSLWKVDDAATTLLMERFYENRIARKMPAATALREAKLWLRNLPGKAVELKLRGVKPIGQDPGIQDETDLLAEEAIYAHPFYWAGFILIGAP